MRTQLIVLLFSLVLLGGCGGTTIKEEPPLSPQSSKGLDRLAAYDFVNVLVQVDEFHPDSTTLQMMNPDNGFGNALKRVLLEANYDVETVENSGDPLFVDYSKVNNQDKTSTYSMSVGPIFIERDYLTTQSGELQPYSELLVEGADASLISLSDSPVYTVNVPVKPVQATNDVPVEIESVPLASDIEQSKGDANTVANPSFIVLVNGDENPAGYSEGETLVFTLQAQRDVRLSCYFQDPNATVMRMYPNRFASNAYFAAGRTVRIPSTDEWSVHATRAGSKDEVLCVSVESEHELAMDEFDSSPDFEVMAYKSLDELLVNLSAAIGISPETKRLSINVY